MSQVGDALSAVVRMEQELGGSEVMITDLTWAACTAWKSAGPQLGCWRLALAAKGWVIFGSQPLAHDYPYLSMD